MKSLTQKIQDNEFSHSELVKMVIDSGARADNVYRTSEEEMYHTLKCLKTLHEVYFACPDIDIKTLVAIFSKSLFCNQTVLQINFQLSNATIDLLTSSDICFIKKHLLHTLTQLDKDEEAYIIDLNIIRQQLDNRLINLPVPELALYGLLD